MTRFTHPWNEWLLTHYSTKALYHHIFLIKGDPIVTSSLSCGVDPYVKNIRTLVLDKLTFWNSVKSLLNPTSILFVEGIDRTSMPILSFLINDKSE